MKILLTGFSGTLGRPVARALIGQSHEVRALLYSRAIDRRDLESGIEIVWGNLYDHDRFAELTKGVDAVVHAAWENKQWPEEGFEAANVEGSVRLFQDAQANGVERFIYISSVGVYGLRPRSDGLPMSEDTPPVGQQDSLDVYPWAKIRIEKALQEASEGSAMALTIIRPGLLFSDAKVPAKRLLHVGGRTFALLVGTGRNHLPYIHVADVADMIVKDLKSDRRGAIYNAVPSEPMSAARFTKRWGRENRIPLHVIKLPVRFFTTISLLAYHLKRNLGRRAFRPNVVYQSATATRNVVYSCARARHDLAWVDERTRRIANLLE